MYRLLPFFLSLILISCSSKRDEQQKIDKQLFQVDKLVYSNPDAARDSLDNIYKDELTMVNLAYYNLLWSIVKENTGDYIQNDTSIITTVEWYRTHKNEWNLCRALLYKAHNKVRYSISDTSVLDNLKEAEGIFLKNKFSRPQVEALIYRDLGVALNKIIIYKKLKPSLIYDENKGSNDFYTRMFKNREANIAICEAYLNKSATIYRKLGDTLNEDLVKLDFFDLYYFPGRADKAYTVLFPFLERDNLLPEVRYSLYTKLALVYRSYKMWDKSIYFTKKLITENLKAYNNEKSLAPFYKSISISFHDLNQIDSSIIYLKMGVETGGKDGIELSYYYFLLSSFYKEINDLENAYHYMSEAYSELRANNTRQFIIRENRLKKYSENINHKLQIVTKEKREIINFAIIGFLLMVVLTIYSLITKAKIRQKLKGSKDECRKKIAAISEEKSLIWFINEILKATTGLMPEFIDSVGMDAARSRKVSKEIYDSLSTSVNNVRTKAKVGITEIAREEGFVSAFPEIAHLSDLSYYEKVILVLINNDFSTREIAEMLVTNQPSIRTIKSKIKDKLLAEKGLPYDVFKVFPFLNKD